MLDYIDTLQKRFGGSGLIETGYLNKDVVQAMQEADEISGLTLAGGFWDASRAFGNVKTSDLEEFDTFSATLDWTWNIGTGNDEARVRKISLSLQWVTPTSFIGGGDVYREMMTVVIAGSSAVFNSKIEKMMRGGSRYFTMDEYTTELKNRHLEAFQSVLEQFLGK